MRSICLSKYKVVYPPGVAYIQGKGSSTPIPQASKHVFDSLKIFVHALHHHYSMIEPVATTFSCLASVLVPSNFSLPYGVRARRGCRCNGQGVSGCNILGENVDPSKRSKRNPACPTSLVVCVEC